MNRKKAELIAEQLKLLANPMRVLMIFELMGKEATPGELARKIDVGETVISQHLRTLRKDGIVKCRKEGLKKPYSLCEGIIAPTILQILIKSIKVPDS